MFTCLWQLWDWIDPPLFTTTMESKKLQQLQQANSHLAPIAQTKAPGFHHPHGDYRPSRSPVFQNYPQYQSLASNFAQINMTNNPAEQQLHSKSFQQHNAQLGGFSNPYQDQIYQSSNEKIYHQHQARSQNIPGVHHSTTTSHVHPATRLQQQFQLLQQEKMQEQLRTEREAIAHQQQTFAMRQQLNPPVPNFQLQSQTSSMSTLVHQSISNVPQQLQNHQHQLQALQNRNLPPSSLNLSNQYQPAQGPLKLNNVMQQQQNQQAIYQQQQQQQQRPINQQQGMQQSQQQQQHQMNLQQQQAIYQQQILQNKNLLQQLHQQQQQHQQQQLLQQQQQQNQTQTPSDTAVPIIQQNIPGQVVNQAVQTQISSSYLKNKEAESPQTSVTPSTPMTPQTPVTPSHSALERKKSEPVHSLKSPVTKRAPTAPVAISGWLYKQGSEGLKVWRKRWFVLSEYCLFYYKGPEEEKILGSVLLPSYRISPCLNEDKVYRKFAFKCEHTNMRTYVLAAETMESMAQWVRALTMASMMQGSSESESQPSISSLNPSGGDNSDSGIHTFQSQQSKISVPQGPVTPASDNGHQPLYANAPPKPKRVTDGGYSSPSPENGVHHHPPQPQQQLPTKSPIPGQDPIYDTRYKQANMANMRQNAKTPDPTLSLRMQNMRLENKSPSALKSQTLNYPYNHDPQIRSNADQEMYMQKMMLHQQQLQAQKYLGAGNNTIPMAYNAERRTPDTYGPPRPNMDRRTFGDYEDIYNLQQQAKQQQQQQPPLEPGSYRRPMSPTRYDNNIQIPPMPSRYTPNFLEHQAQQQQQQQQQQAQQQYPAHPVQMRTKNLQSVARPHSADFLDYEARNPVTTRMKAEPAQAPRPKSSLDINRSPQDNVYYSEASYAEKMRQSALYLQNKGHTMPGKLRGDGSQDPFQKSEDQINHAATMSHSLQRDSDLVRANRYDITEDLQGSASVPRIHRANMMNNKGYMSQQEQFLRSASARLPKKDEDPNLRDGERKREESMKRLLEWKQRMLQSPLTRKGPQLSLPPTQQQNQQSNMMMHPPKSPLTVQQYQNEQQQQQKSNHALQRSRSDTHANAGYNSYSSDDEASVSVRNIRNIPKVPLTVKPDPNDTLNRSLNHMNGGIHSNQLYYYDNYMKPEQQQQQQLMNQQSSHSIYMNGIGSQQLNSEQMQHQYAVVKKSGSKRDINAIERENPALFKNLNMSAGDLLNRTHEELILLLIQLRRQNSSTARAIEQCCTEIHDVQNRIRTQDGHQRAESVSHLEKLKQQLCELERQYEKSKPLVNLVDNMVKLGSLYRGGNQRYPNETTTLDRLEFNQRIQERRYLQEEQRQWDRMSPNQHELQSKVQQLYQLDQLMQEESGTLQILQRDKEELERALSGLRSKIQTENAPAVAVEAARRQQHILERELSRVHLLLAENSKKLEQTVASNARLEQELLVLRQKLQASRDTKNVQSSSGLGHHGSDVVGGSGSGTTAVLESELRRVQQLVGDMQRQRQELSQAVRQLTDNSNSIYEEMNKNASHIKKRTSSNCWTETDLDSMISLDQSRSESMIFSQSSDNGSITPLFVDISSNSSANIMNCTSSSKIGDVMNGKINGYSDDLIESIALENDDLLENSVFGNLSNQEKQEIKTVRIVKRESERRQRDRERSGLFSSQNLDQVLEEEAQLFNNALNNDYGAYQRSKSLPRTYLETHEVYRQQSAPKSPGNTYTLPGKYDSYYNSLNMNQNSYPVSMIDRTADLYSDSNSQVKTERTVQYNNYYNSNSTISNSNSNISNGLNKKTDSIQSLTKTLGELSPVFQSEAARQIIIEMSGSNSGDDNENTNNAKNSSNKHRRAVPKEKRRHFTAPHHVNAKSMQTIQSENDMNKNNVNWRARDDLDMEVALRPRINAPDVVRSALGQREKISENTIDKLFGAPSKILIPERYIPEQAPELSPEEKKRRQEKVEAIKKMLSETTPTITGNDTAMPPSQISAEKKQREHLLQLNQILAQQVMQMSKIVADHKQEDHFYMQFDEDALMKKKSIVETPENRQKLEIVEIYSDIQDAGNSEQKAMAVLPSQIVQLNEQLAEDDDHSPVDPLPLYQQRDNYFS